ncbi:uncharacterized protein Z518_10293 [Rhinocladiella mackenziei CBS 650.93]|uniref:Xylanolytic transcriptional activator regulatory domain-containing protein n=1 Tax=Rhinocladiella mackenziei CBS 650.93 TaxID=1442369 RepID=A0A0D2IA82_9EURO|nr:uncharacterized protein Z518_10293 [Rhinocladiella mackenziei CBS 650.93]KIX00156.1 hypothetical protein Z518_10293 [Rhinocladiella mackenziei CBS 650.93]
MLHTYYLERYCILASQLPPGSVLTELIDLYFSDADWYFMSLDRYYFEDLLRSWTRVSEVVILHRNLKQLSRESQYFPALLFQFLAVALQLLPLNTKAALALQVSSFTEIDKLSESYSKAGLEIIGLLGRQQPTITSVEHDIMRLTWLKNCSRGSEAWHFLSHSIRQAQLLGLHLEPEVKQEPEESVESALARLWYAEHKRKVWARVFMLDGFMAFTLGRPRQINKDDCSVALPLARDLPDNPLKTVFLPTTPSEEPSTTTFIIFLCGIATKIHELLSSGAGKSHTQDYDKVTALHKSILALQGDLHPAFRPQNPDTSWDTRSPQFPKVRQQMITTANSFLMNLHRPHVRDHPASRQEAIEAALRVLEAQQAMFDLVSENQHRIYGFSFYTIDAAVLLSALVIDQPPESNVMFDRIKTSLEQAVSRLEALGTRMAIAKTGEMLLKQCLSKIQPPAPCSVLGISSSRGESTAGTSPLIPTTSLSLQPRVASVPPQLSRPISSYQSSQYTFNFHNPQFSDLQSMPSPLDSANFYNYLGGTYGFAWPGVNMNTNTNINADVGGPAVGGYQDDTTEVNVDGTDIFSYDFDGNPYFFFGATLLDQAASSGGGTWQ